MVEEAARYVRTGQRVIREHVNAGLVFAVRIGKWIRIPRERFLEDLMSGRISLAEGEPEIRRSG